MKSPAVRYNERREIFIFSVGKREIEQNFTLNLPFFVIKGLILTI